MASDLRGVFRRSGRADLGGVAASEIFDARKPPGRRTIPRTLLASQGPRRRSWSGVDQLRWVRTHDRLPGSPARLISHRANLGRIPTSRCELMLAGHGAPPDAPPPRRDVGRRTLSPGFLRRSTWPVRAHAGFRTADAARPRSVKLRGIGRSGSGGTEVLGIGRRGLVTDALLSGWARRLWGGCAGPGHVPSVVQSREPERAGRGAAYLIFSEPESTPAQRPNPRVARSALDYDLILPHVSHHLDLGSRSISAHVFRTLSRITEPHSSIKSSQFR